MTMRAVLGTLSIICCLLVIVIFFGHDRFSASRSEEDSASEAETLQLRSDWFMRQRAFPHDSIPQRAYHEAMARRMIDQRAALRRLGASSAGPAWQQIGPYNISGLVTALAVTPGGATVYAGSNIGGVFKSTNAGVDWTPITDDLPLLSIGALALDPDDPGMLYVGTGAANAAQDCYNGNGLWRTPDGGASWEHLGLEETARIGQVVVDPGNSSRVFVAAMGKQYTKDSNRGLYRSEDAGQTWSQVLFVNDSTGVIDIAINPAHPETVFCATWERIAAPNFRAHGPGCGIWRSVDHGATWVRLLSGFPPPSDFIGRIGLAIAASRPSTIYAQIISGPNFGFNGLGFYRSDNGGDTWTRTDQTGFTNNFLGFGWFFGEVAVDPTDPEVVWSLGPHGKRSTDGGVNFLNRDTGVHLDHHAMWIDPSDPLHIYVGTDGGFFWTSNGGVAWTKSLDLPIAQFYAGDVDPADHNRVLGGTQDTGVLMSTGVPTAWTGVFTAADGFHCVFDPTDPNTIFFEYQYLSGGNGPLRSIDGGATFMVPTGIDFNDRIIWNAPFVMDPSNHDLLLAGTHRVYRSLDNGLTYTAISGDLSANPNRGPNHGALTTLDISPLSPRIYYAGTDDGKVWRSRDQGATWDDISAGLPLRWVTRVTADPVDSNVVYVTHSGFTLDEKTSHVHRSVNQGDAWVSIVGDLPDIPTNDVVVDPSDPQRLFVATDVGIYFTQSLGTSWTPLGTGLPPVPVMDLMLHPGSRTLYGATHGRSMWLLDLNGLVAVTPVSAPVAFALSEPAPNPSRERVRFVMNVSSPAKISVDVFDALGRRVALVANRPFTPGRHVIEWNGRDAVGRTLGSGMYFVRAQGSGSSVTRKLVRVD